jgi:uncharacterized protein (TIGR03437 family)
MNAAPTHYRFLVAIVFAVLTIQSPAGTHTSQTRRFAERPLNQPARVTLSRDYGNLPLAFEPNVGQTDARVRFLARGGGMMAFFTDTETVMALSRSGQAKTPDRPGRPEAVAGEVERAVVRMKLAGASRPRRATGFEKLPGISNYFIGNDPAKWRTNVPQYARIQYESVYPGIDMVWYGNQRQLEYDFVVAPGGDPKQIQVAYEGAESLGLEANGDLVLRTTLGEVRQQKPRVYQEIGGKRVEVAARYAIAARNLVRFELAGYNRKRDLRIDPVVLAYSTYLGGSGAGYGYGIAVDAGGYAYAVGATNAVDFPTRQPYQGAYQGGTNDVAVTKLAPGGNALVYSTYLGGADNEKGAGIAVDAAGSAYIAGWTASTNFPVMQPYQGAYQGGEYDAFVTKLAPAGNALVYSTYLGGGGADAGTGIAVDGAGSAYVSGWTQSTNFPTQSPYQAAFQGGAYDAFVTKLTPAGSALAYSTYLGGSASDYAYAIAVDAAGAAYITGATNSANFPTQSPYQSYQGGKDVFVTKLTPAGSALSYSTYLGGSGDDNGYAIAVDGASSAYVAGSTASANFPIQSPYQTSIHGSEDAFVSKLAPAGNALAYSTYLGGSGTDAGYGIALDGVGSAYVTGVTASADFPTQSPYQPYHGSADVFVTELTPAGNTLTYSSCLGGSGDDYGFAIAVDGAGSVYVTGQTASTNFPTQSPYQAALQGTEDAFVAKMSGLSALPLIGGVLNAASGQAAISPNAWVSIYGANFVAAGFSDDWSKSIVNGNLPTTLDGVSVSVGGNPAYVSFVSPGQINVLTPNVASGNASVTVTTATATTTAPATVTAQPFSPAFFPWPNGQPVATHLDYSWAVKNGTFAGATTVPAKPGEYIILWGTGFGPTTPAAPTGVTIPAGTTYYAANPVSVTIGNLNAPVYGTALASGFAGLYQVVVLVPATLSNGDYALVATVGGVATAPTTLTVQN